MISEIINIPAINTAPSAADILRAQGISKDETPNRKTMILVNDAIQCLMTTIQPVGILLGISKDDFVAIYKGDGMNEPQAPLGGIFGFSDDLAIFTVTLGERVSAEISDHFNNTDLALASMLDSAASEAAEMAAAHIESYYRSHLERTGRLDVSTGIMRFSPGYCGWHIGAQKKLFDFLKPHQIGVALNDSLLMQPLKSISGVIVSGRKEIFNFDDSFSFCAECITHSCQDRIKALYEKE